MQVWLVMTSMTAGNGKSWGSVPKSRESHSATPAWWKDWKLVGLPSTCLNWQPLRGPIGNPLGLSGLMTVTRVPSTANSARPAASSSKLSPHPTTCPSYVHSLVHLTQLVCTRANDGDLLPGQLQPPPCSHSPPITTSFKPLTGCVLFTPASLL